LPKERSATVDMISPSLIGGSIGSFTNSVIGKTATGNTNSSLIENSKSTFENTDRG